MSEKIAVHCPTSYDWDRVQEKVQRKYPDWRPKEWNQCKENTCIAPSVDWGDRSPGFGRMAHWKNEGYTIISASEYLKDGKMKKIGIYKDLKFPTRDYDTNEIMPTLPCGESNTNWACGGIECLECLLGDSNKAMLTEYLSLKVKPTTKQEKTMKENNTNPDVLAVFGSKVKGDELVVIDRHFDEAMLRRILMEKFSKEIQIDCNDAEAKRLEAEEK